MFEIERTAPVREFSANLAIFAGNMGKTIPHVRAKEFEYILPADRIARFPLEKRDESSLLVYQGGKIDRAIFKDICGFFNKNDLLIFNETRVVHARLRFQRKSGARIEIFCLSPHEPSEYNLSFANEGSVVWKCLVGNAKKWKEEYLEKEGMVDGTPVILKARMESRDMNALLVRFQWYPRSFHFSRVIECFGEIPIPPYLEREAIPEDDGTYQTVYSRVEGSVAAPTAGLHFTEELLSELDKRGTEKTFINLHVGAGTFIPVKSSDARDHPMHTEEFHIEKRTLVKLTEGKRCIAVGTTSCRSLESAYWLGVKLIAEKGVANSMHLDQWEAYHLPQDVPLKESFKAIIKNLKDKRCVQLRATTSLMIVPGYSFRVVEGMITNFHQPGSTLLMLVSAFIGDDWKRVYAYALKNGFRFLSYGDSSLLIPGKVS